MNEILKYQPVIDQTLSEMNVKRAQKEDLSQQCFVALLENADLLEGPDDVANAAAICKAAVYAFLRGEEDVRFIGKKFGKRIPVYSLDDPTVWYQALKIPAPGQKDPVSESEIQDAILALPFEDYRVIYSLYVDGKTLAQTGADLGLTEKGVRVRQVRGIKALRERFEVQ